MMKPLILLFCVSALSSSCIYHKDFTNYRRDPFDSLPIRMDGIYFAEKPDDLNNLPYRYLAFYDDGTSYLGLDNSKIHPSLEWSQSYFDSTFKPFWKFGTFYWGAFVIRQNVLTIQSFIISSSDNSSRVVIDSYRVLNDSTMQLVQRSIPFRDTVVKYSPFINYRLHDYPLNPDSSLAWFKHRKWYKKNIVKKLMY